LNFAKNRPDFWFFSVSARPKSNIRFNGREYANADEMPSDVRAAYDRAVDDMPPLHSGARLAAKLNAKIIVNGNEFNNAGEMSVDDRHLYHEALEALFPPGIAVSATQTPEIRSKKQSSFVVALRSCLFRAARVLRRKR
jgi:hypothetical protein